MLSRFRSSAKTAPAHTEAVLEALLRSSVSVKCFESVSFHNVWYPGCNLDKILAQAAKAASLAGPVRLLIRSKNQVCFTY